MAEIFLVLRVLHIVAGTVALFVAPGALATRKGSLWHRRWGNIFVGAMMVVGMTALVMTFLPNHANPFLRMVAVFGFYLAFSGRRVLSRKPGRAPSAAAKVGDAAIAVAMVGAAGMLLFMGGQAVLRGNLFGIVFLVFGTIGGLLAVLDGRDLFLTQEFTGKRWLRGHIARMTGAYIAALTAFSAVNLGHWIPDVPPVVVWLWPTAVLAPMIGVMIRRHAQERPEATR
jgi:hypothetical protein